MKRTLLICVALWVLGAVLPATAQNTITVADGTSTNGYVPIYGYYCDNYLKSEYVIPAADLAAMTGARYHLADVVSVDYGRPQLDLGQCPFPSVS